MKLRLPHKFQAALMAAIASVSFTTLSTGTLTAAGFAFFGHRAAAADAADDSAAETADDSGATIDIGDTNLDPQAAMEEEEGKVEDTKEPDSAPVNQAGFNGSRGQSSDDTDTDLTIGVTRTSAPEDLEDAADGADQVGTASSGSSLPSDNLGFTSSPYATGSSSNGSGSVFEVTANPAPTQTTDYQSEPTQQSPASNTSSTNNTASGISGTGLSGFSGLGSYGSTGGSLGSSLGVTSGGISVDGGSSGSNLSPTPNLGAVTYKPVTITSLSSWNGYNASTGTAKVGHDDSGTYYGGQNNSGQAFNSQWSYVVTLDVSSLTTSTTYNLGTIYLTQNSNSGYGETATLTTASSMSQAATVNFGAWGSTNNTGTIDLSEAKTLTFVFSHDNTANNATYFDVYLDDNFTTKKYTKTVTGIGFSNTSVQARYGALNGWDYFNNSANKVRMTADANVGTYTVSSAGYTTEGLPSADELLAYYNSTHGDGLVWAGNSTSHTWTNNSSTPWTGGTFTNGSNVVFNATAANKEVLVQSSITAGTMTVSDAYTFKANSSGSLTAGALNLANNSAVTLWAEAASRTFNLGDVSVDGAASIMNRWNHATQNIDSIQGDSDATLTLISNHCNSTGTWNIGKTNGSAQAYSGKLVLQVQDTDGYNNRTVNFNIQDGGMLSGATLETKTGQLKSGSDPKTMTNNINLGASEVKFGGINDGVNDSSATSRQVTWTIKPTSGTSTLTLDGTGTYSTSAAVGANVNIKKTGSGTQTFTGNMGAFNGSISVSGGTLALDSAISSASTVNVTNGAILNLGNSLTTTGDVTISSGSKLKLASGNLLTSGGDLTLTGSTLDLRGMTFTTGQAVTLATSNTGTINYSGVDVTLSPRYSSDSYTLTQSGNNLTFTYTGPEPTENTLHIYLLTGQSNSLGAVKGDPASSAMLTQYASSVKMWDGNMSGSVTDPDVDTANKAWDDTNKHWFTVQQQQTPTGEGVYGPAGTPYANIKGKSNLVGVWGGNVVMGPEYGFSSMMERQGWDIESGKSDIAIVKVSRDGGANTYWDPESSGNICPQILDSVVKALLDVDTTQYTNISLDGLLFLQGETGNQTQGSNVKNVLNRLINYLQNGLAQEKASGRLQGISDSITVSIGDSIVLGEPAGTGACSVASATVYKNWAATDPETASFVYTHDMNIISSGDSLNLHFDGNSQITIGARYAYALAQVEGLDTTRDGEVRVRSQYYGDTALGESASVSLNDSSAWWQSTGDKVAYTSASMANTVAVWDVSSADMANLSRQETLTGDLSVKGIRIEDPHSNDENPGDHKATITINNASGTHTLSVGSSGIVLQQGNLTIGANLEATDNQTWNTNATPASGSAQQNTLNLNGTTTIDANKTVTVEGASTVNVATLSGAGDLTVDGTGSVVTLNGASSYTGNITVDSGTLALTSSMTLDDVNVGASGTLKLAGVNSPLTTTGTFTLASGSTLDLSSYTFSGTNPVTLVTTSDSGTITDLSDWSEVTLVAAPKNASLSKDSSGNLVLTFRERANLIWDGGTDKWDAGTTQHWHKSGEQPGTSMFAQNDNVTFETGDSTANLAANISAGSMTLQSGANVTVNTKGYDLSVTSLSNTGTLTKAGNGSMEVDNAVTLRGTGNSGLKASVTGGELHIKTTGTTVDGAKLVADNGTGEQGTDAFTKLFKGDAISVIGNGKLVLEGNINAVQQNSGAVTLESGIADLEVTGDVTVNRWGAGTYQLNDHSMEVGGNFWLKNHQNLNLAGGNLAVGGSLTLAHESNTASGGTDYRAAVTATGDSTVKLGDIKFYSGGNSVSLTDSTVTFTKDSGNVLSRIGNSASAAANTVTLTNDTLVAQENSWTMNAMTGNDNTTVTVSGDTKLDIGAGKSITIGGATVGGSMDFGSSTGSLVLNGSTVAATGLDVTGGNVTVGGETTLLADATRTIYQPVDEDANGWISTKTDVWVVARSLDDNTNFTIANGATFKHSGDTLTGSVEDGDLLATGAPVATDTVYYIGVTNTNYSSLGSEVTGKATAYDVGEGKTFVAAGIDLQNKELILEQDATWQTGSGGNFNNQQLQTLTLNGDAEVRATNNGGLIGSNFGETSMNLNGHTLTVEGNGHFALFNTTATGVGKISVANNGCLQVGHSGRTSSADLKDVVVDVVSGGHLTIDNNSSIKVEGLTGSGTIQRDGGSGGTITIENNLGTDCTFSGSISSTPNLVMDAASTGTQTINLTSSATLGTVTVNGGTLALSSTGTLTTGAVSVADGATLDFGNATQTTTTGALTLAGGSTLKLSGTDEDLLHVSSITANTGSILDLSSLTIDPSVMSYTLLTSTAVIDSSVSSNITVTGLSSSRNYTLAVEGNALVLTFEDLAKTKIWDNNTRNGMWSNETSDTNWHTPNNVYTHVGFDSGDRVQFTGKNAVNVTLGDDVAPADMSIDSGKTVTINTAGNDLTVARGIDGAGASLVVKAQEGDAISTGRSDVTLKNLTLDNGTTTLGGHTEVANKMTVTDGAVVTANAAVVADSLDISGESTVNLEAGGTAATTKVTDSTLTVGANSSLGQLTLDSGEVVNNSTLTLSNTQNMVVSGDSRLTGTGTTTTTGILINDDSTLTVDDGQTVSITTPNGVIGGSGEGSTLTLGNATLTGTSSWTLADTVDTVNLTSTTGSGTTFNTNGHVITVDADLSGAGILTKTGTGTLTLAGDNSTFTGNTVVSAGVVKVNDANGLANSADVSVANGATLWFNSDTTASLSGTTSIADGATLHLGSENALTTTGSLTLSADSTLNLYGMPITSGKMEYVLATGSSITLADGFDMDNVIVEYGTHPAVGSTPKIEVKNIEGGQQALVLTYDIIDSNTLFWNGGTDSWTGTDKWHDYNTGEQTTFATYDDVFFDASEYTDSTATSAQANVTQNTDVHNMSIIAREDMQLHTVTTNVNSDTTLTVDFLYADDNTKLVKSGGGTALVGIDDPVFGANVEVTAGTLTTQVVDLAGEGMTISGDISRTGGTLNIEVGRDETPTNATFTGAVSGVASFTVNEGSNATFNGEVSVPASQNLVMQIDSDATATFTKDVSLTANSWRFGGDGTVNFLGTVEVAEKTGNYNSIEGNLTVNVNTLKPTANQVDLRLDPGTDLHINTLDMTYSDQDTLYFTFQNTYGTQVDRDSVQIDKMVVDGSRGIGSNVSSIDGLANYQAGGDVNISELVNAEGSTADDVLRLCNYNSRLQSKVTYGGWNIPMVFNLGKDTQEGEAFEGVIRVQDSRNTEDWYGTTEAHKQTVVVLEDEYVASEAVIELKNYSRYSDFGVGINTENAKVTGIKDYASDSYKTGNRSVIFSGPMASANTAIPESDDTLRTLELIGKTGDTASTVYSTSAGVDKNLNIVKEGAGVQEFKGDSSNFNGSIDAKDGLLRFLNTATLTVQDLTLAANGSTTDGTLAVRSGSSASGADGTAAVHGTLKVNSGSKLDSNLTMATDSTMNVRGSLTTQPGEYEGKTDYVGGLDMLNNSLTLQSGAYLSDADRSALLSMQWGERYELAYGLSSLTLGENTYTDELLAERGNPDSVEASKYFQNLQEEDYYICFSGVSKAGPGGNVGTVYIVKLPEPATSTLSLLALCALAARRRRK